VATPPWGTPEEFDPEKAWKLIQNLRAESDVKAARAAEKATADATRAISETLGKALGIIPEEVLDPAKLQAQIASSESQTKQLAVELAVYRAAESANANAVALLDSRSFLTKVQSLEPTDVAGITAAITQAVAENPLLAKAVAGATVTPRMLPNAAQGGSALGAPTLAAQLAAAEKAGNVREAISLKTAMALQQQQ
jgi:hypothetical protein